MGKSTVCAVLGPVAAAAGIVVGLAVMLALLVVDSADPPPAGSSKTPKQRRRAVVHSHPIVFRTNADEFRFTGGSPEPDQGRPSGAMTLFT